MAAAKVSSEVKKRGIIDNVKARAQSLWAHVDEVRNATIHPSCEELMLCYAVPTVSYFAAAGWGHMLKSYA